MLKSAYSSIGLLIGEANDLDKNGGVVFKNPRLVQITRNDAGGTQFNVAPLFGCPDFLEIPSGTIMGNVTDKTVKNAYIENVTGIIVPCPGVLKPVVN